MTNDSLKRIGEVLTSAKSVLVFPHINIDGDALGSSVALAHILREMGKECFVLMEDGIPDNLRFLDRGYCTYDQDVIPEPDVTICVDCGEPGRFPKRVERFKTGKVSICIDHHSTSDPFCDYNHIDPGACATGELIYKLFVAMGETVDKEAGEALFAAITTDSGNFQYNNTSKETHMIIADLYDAGIDFFDVSVELYQNVRLEKIKLISKVMEALEVDDSGRFAMGIATSRTFEETGTDPLQAEGIIAEIRNIKGVEIAAMLKEREGGKVEVSLRSKHMGNVSNIAVAFGGGGHQKAAGCTMECSVEEAAEKVRKAALEELASCDKMMA